MANQYHDETGRFCSKNEMGNAVERLSDLMSSAPTQEARNEAAGQWIALKTEYLTITNLDFDGKLAELDARIFSTHSRTELRKLEAERDQVQLEADASDEGYNALLRKSLAARNDSASRFADDYRIQRAAVYRTERETKDAIEDYKAGVAPRYESTIALFSGTHTRVSRTSTHVYVAEATNEYEVQHEFALDDSNFDKQVLGLRQRVGDRLADQSKFGKSKLGMDLYSGDLNAVYFGSTDQTAHIVRSGSSQVVADVEFNENGAFVKASIAHPSGDGAIETLDSPAHFRSFLARAKGSKVPALPSWKSGVEEPKLPAYAAPANNDMEDPELLF